MSNFMAMSDQTKACALTIELMLISEGARTLSPELIQYFSECVDSCATLIDKSAFGSSVRVIDIFWWELIQSHYEQFGTRAELDKFYREEAIDRVIDFIQYKNWNKKEVFLALQYRRDEITTSWTDKDSLFTTKVVGQA